MGKKKVPYTVEDKSVPYISRIHLVSVPTLFVKAAIL